MRGRCGWLGWRCVCMPPIRRIQHRQAGVQDMAGGLAQVVAHIVGHQPLDHPVMRGIRCMAEGIMSLMEVGAGGAIHGDVPQ